MIDFGCRFEDRRQGNVLFANPNDKASAFDCLFAAGKLWRDRQMSNEIPMSNVKFEDNAHTSYSAS